MIRYAEDYDLDLLCKYDRHISRAELGSCIKAKRVLIMFHDDIFIGWLRFNLFWDNIPFMNMLHFVEEYSSRLVSFWEKEMLKSGYKMVLTSTQSDERGQFFYRKNGYVDCGSLLLPGEPLEIILRKNLE